MSDRKFTPPTEFPAEYVTSGGHKAFIIGETPSSHYPFVGWVVEEDGACVTSVWTREGKFNSYLSYLDDDLHDLPVKQVHWANERIWAFKPDIFDNCSVWQDQPSPAGDTTEYIRADLVEAAVKRALKGAQKACERAAYDGLYAQDDQIGLGCLRSRDCIRALYRSRDYIRALDPAQFIDGDKT